MLRHCQTIAVHLLVGLLLNLFVAWSVVLIHGHVVEEWRPRHNPRDEFPLVVFVTRHLGHEIVSGCARSGTLLDRYPDEVQFYHGHVWWPRRAVAVSRDAYGVASGWPFLTLRAWSETEQIALEGDQGIQFRPHTQSGFEWKPEFFDVPSAPDRRTVPPTFPLQPVWTGLILNTMFYATASWLLIAGPFRLRRFHRRHRRRCERCGYSLLGFPVCPECGTKAQPCSSAPINSAAAPSV